MDSVNVGELVDAYLGIRTAREVLAKKFEGEDAELKADLSSIEAALLALCNEVNVDSLKTDHGTVMRQVQERYWAADWDILKNFIRENDALDLFERRIHQTNTKQFMTEHHLDALPGVNCNREYKIVVRRANS